MAVKFMGRGRGGEVDICSLLLTQNIGAMISLLFYNLKLTPSDNRNVYEDLFGQYLTIADLLVRFWNQLKENALPIHRYQNDKNRRLNSEILKMDGYFGRRFTIYLRVSSIRYINVSARVLGLSHFTRKRKYAVINI